MSKSGWEAIPNVRERSRDHPGCSEDIGRPSRMSWSDRVALSDFWEWWKALTNIRE